MNLALTNGALKQRTYTEEQIQLIKNTCCKGGTDDDLALLLYVSQQRGLDPLTKQIYSIKRWDSDLQCYVRTLQTAIDGFRVIASRTGKYRGQTPYEWCGEDGVWVSVWIRKEMPHAARVGVYHADFNEPVFATALFSAYKQTKKDSTLTNMWATHGVNQIGKCAEALALRKAFPEDLSGIYAEEEMMALNDEVKQGSKYDFADINKHATAAQLHEMKVLIADEHCPPDDAIYYKVCIEMAENEETEEKDFNDSVKIHALLKAEAVRALSRLRSEIDAARALQARQTEEEHSAAIADWYVKIDECTHLEDFNSTLSELSTMEPGDIKTELGKQLSSKANAKGYKYDKIEKQYIQKASAKQ